VWLPCYKPDKPPPRRVYGVIHLTVPGVNPSGFPLGVYPKLSRVLLVNASRGWFNYNVHTYVYWYYSDLLIALYADKVGVAYLSLYSLYVKVRVDLLVCMVPDNFGTSKIIRPCLYSSYWLTLCCIVVTTYFWSNAGSYMSNRLCLEQIHFKLFIQNSVCVYVFTCSRSSSNNSSSKEVLKVPVVGHQFLIGDQERMR